jgi:hypothetical protein
MTSSIVSNSPGRRTGGAPIAIAGFRRIYSTTRVESALGELGPTAHESL